MERRCNCPTKTDRQEFRLFCRNATTTQLYNIVAKERDAGRDVYQEIAELELYDRIGE